MKRLLYIVIPLIMTFVSVQAQIADFSQVYNNYVYLNPAFVGTTTCPHAFSSYRTKNLSNASYNTMYMSFDTQLGRTSGNVGFSFLQDFQDNIFSETELLGLYAHTFQVAKKTFVNASLAAGYVYGATKCEDLVFSNMLDIFSESTLPSAEEFEKLKRHNFNSELGVLLYNDVFYAGMTIKNLQGNISDKNKSIDLFPRIFSFHGMAKFSTTKAYLQRYLIWLYPHINVVVGGTSSYAQLGLILQKWMVQFGGAYRQNFPCNAKSFSFFIGVVEKKFRFAYNCDMTIKSVNRFGAHEVSLGYQFDCREKKKKFEAVKAPTF